MALRRRLSGTDVDALFSGGTVTDPPEDGASSGRRPYVPRYSACGACGAVEPGLAEFRGEEDFQATVGLDGPVRDLVRRLRRATGKRTVLLCSWCIHEEEGAADGATIEPGPPGRSAQTLW